MRSAKSPKWRVWIDTGGTFTDCLAVDAEGILHREKVLSNGALRGSIENIITPREFRVSAAWRAPVDVIRGFAFFLLGTRHPEVKVERYNSSESTIVLDKPLPNCLRRGAVFEIRSPEEAPILAARLVTGIPIGSSLPAMSMRLATTLGTNALLERRGAPTALFITKGFGDLLRIGNQQRPELFELDIRKPEPLYRATVEVPERIAADGTVLMILELDRLAADVLQFTRAGIRCAAIALMHSYANPKHEHELAEYLLNRGFHHVSCSSDLAPFIKILSRAETSVADAYLSPVIDDYLDRVQAPLAGGSLQVMTSAGGIVQRQSCRAKDILFSGPAGGVVGAALAGRRSGFSRIIAFDMGGTSTDVARFDGDYDYTFEQELRGAHLVAPALAIESVAAGGGSICIFDGKELHVGPGSAGAQPGPACYGAGGPFTLTDVNLLLGRLDPARFDIPINRDFADREFKRLLQSIKKKRNETVERERLLEGLRRIADERMADAIKRISIRRGYDPKDYALVAFGGAGGQHACSVAEHIGIRTIVVPKDASLLSALGLGHAAIERFAERQVLKRLDRVSGKISKWIQELTKEAVLALQREGIESNQAKVRRIIVKLRFTEQDFALQIEHDGVTELEKAFESKYRAVFGYWQEDRPVELESIRVIASSRLDEEMVEKPDKPTFLVDDKKDSSSWSRCQSIMGRKLRAWFGGRWRSVPAFERSNLRLGDLLHGPALIFERYTVIAVESGWSAQLDSVGSLVLRQTAGTVYRAKPVQPEIVRLELFTNRFRTIAQEMGEMLRRTAVSTNIKERLDFSCAVLDTGGELVANAPHIPVHLGAIGICVRSVREALTMEPGDVIITNHPKYGGSHLPDVTVVTPVHLSDGRLLGYIASRAHHAEIGGVQPGSMPPTASRLAEEGVVIPPMHLFRHGEAWWGVVRRLLSKSSYPSRAVEENLADLRAAVAANRSGASALLRLAEEYGGKTLWHFMAALKERAASRIREAFQKIPDGLYEATEKLDDGSELCVKISVSDDRAHVDFSGSSDVHPRNLNTTPAVVNSVVIYVMRLLVREALPLNEGLMRSITLNLPRGILNPPFPDDPQEAPAVFGGNVETSQRLVDSLLKALGLAACSQGTMNNVLFGNDDGSYYETVCGGTGAGPGFHGASAVHSHMTNTRITDPEIIEHRYPVRIERFAIRRDSGGDGEYRGGDGVVREISFLEKMSLHVLGQHRKIGPYGLDGGQSGKKAVQRLIRTNGETIELDSIDACDVSPGDRFVLKTPGGGGYGDGKRRA